MHPSEQKAQLRASIQERLRQVGTKERAAESRTLCRTLTQLIPSHIRRIGAFFPLASEADLRPLIEERLAAGNEVYLPRFNGRNMTFHRIESLARLAPGPFGIPEPAETAPLLDPSAEILLLVPGLAFDAQGNRLGRGNGAFDAWIAGDRARLRPARYWGTCLDCQVVHEIPTEPHDQRMDAVITARGKLHG